MLLSGVDYRAGEDSSTSLRLRRLDVKEDVDVKALGTYSLSRRHQEPMQTLWTNVTEDGSRFSYISMWFVSRTVPSTLSRLASDVL